MARPFEIGRFRLLPALQRRPAAHARSVEPERARPRGHAQAPAPRLTDHERWTQELDRDLPELIAHCQRVLHCIPSACEAKRERLQWQIQQARKRMNYLGARLGRVE